MGYFGVFRYKSVCYPFSVLLFRKVRPHPTQNRARIGEDSGRGWLWFFAFRGSIGLAASLPAFE